jgi:hypothetical protein
MSKKAWKKQCAIFHLKWKTRGKGDDDPLLLPAHGPQELRRDALVRRDIQGRDGRGAGVGRQRLEIAAAGEAFA